MKGTLFDLWSESQSLGWVQWFSFISGLLYIYYASKNNPWCWPWGILSSGLWAYASWFQLHLLSDGILQVIYVVLGFWGWYSWHFRNQSPDKVISKTHFNALSLYFISGTAISIGLGMIMKQTIAVFPMIDAFLSVFSIAATILLIQQKIENWLLWIVINLISIPLFIFRGGHLFAALFFIYFILSIRGWVTWKNILKRRINSDPS